MKTTISTLICIILGVVNAGKVVRDEKLHEIMTTEELKRVFNVAHGEEVPNYAAVSLNWPRISKRSDESVANISIKAFDRDINLLLHPSEGILAGYDTPVYSIQSSWRSPNGFKIIKHHSAMANLGRLYEDRDRLASMIVKRSPTGRTIMSGVIGSEGWGVKPLPNRLIGHIANRQRRSIVNSDDKFDENSIVNHVIYKIPEISDKVIHDDSHMNVISRSERDVADSDLQAPTIVYPEILVIVDYDTYKLHRANLVYVLEYLLAFWNGVDLRYRSLEITRVRLNIAAIVIAKDREVYSFLFNNKVDVDGIKRVERDRAMKEFQRFVKKLELNLPGVSYDVAVSMSPLPMCHQQDETYAAIILGAARVMGACRTYRDRTDAIALITDDGNFQGIFTAAHELGHSFGAIHDGYPNNCSTEVGNIMSGSTKHTANTYDWSPCSVKAFDAFFKDKRSWCLRNEPKTMRKMAADLPGRLLSADQQCERISATKACSIDESICTNLKCRDRFGLGCSDDLHNGAVDGTPCGNGKMCIQGHCVSEGYTRGS